MGPLSFGLGDDIMEGADGSFTGQAMDGDQVNSRKSK